MPGGSSPTRWRAGTAASLNSLTHQFENAINIPASHNAPGGEADIAAHPGVPTAGGSGNQRAGTRFNTAQRTVPDHTLDNPENFDDAPYVPPRVAQAELQPYPALDPRLGNVYDPPNHDIHHLYPYEGGTSPAESHHSVESNWSTSSSSSASSQRLAHGYLVEPTSQYPQGPQPTRQIAYAQYYPAYHGQHRHGLEHVRYGPQPSNAGGSYYRAPPQDFAIDGLLSPEMFDAVSARVTVPSDMNYPVASSQGSSTSPAVPSTNQPPNVSTFSVSTVSPTNSTRSPFLDAGPYLRQQLGLSDHEPISLQSLPDPAPGEKPSTPLPMLIKLAIYGSRHKQLTLQEIYTELENRFQWFREHKNEKAWKNSIRHNLSLNKVFRHVPRPVTEPGKGSYWQLDVSGGEGYKRPRKRRPKNRMMTSEGEDEETSEMDEDQQSPSDPAGLGRSSATPVEDALIDPELRSEGHVVGEGRTRSTTRRAGGGSPYPSQSPRYQQGPLPVVTGQDETVPGQPLVRFGQPSLPTYPQTRPPAVLSSAPFAAMSTSSMGMVPTTSIVARPPQQYMTSSDRTTRIPQLLPRSGIEYVMEPGGLPAARRVRTYPECQGQSQEDTARSSPESSSSGSSRTWNDARSVSEMQRLMHNRDGPS